MFWRLFAAALLLAMATGQGFADPPAVIATVTAEQKPVIAGYSRQAEDLAKAVVADAGDDSRLVDIKMKLDDLARELIGSGVAFRPRLTEINDRLDQIGPPPASGAPAEGGMVTAERNALLKEKADINALLGQAESVSIRVNRLIDQIGSLRRDLFTRTLSKRYDIDYALARDVAREFRSETADFSRAVSSWFRFMILFKLSSALMAAFLAVSAAVVLLVGGRRLFSDLIDADPQQPHPSTLSRLSVAFWSTLVPTAAVFALLGLIYFFLDYYNLLRVDIAAMMRAMFYVLAVVFFVHRLARAVLSPRLPNWRLVRIQSRPARLLSALVTATAVVAGLDYLLSAIFDVMGSSLSLTVGESLVLTVIVGLLVILIGLVKPFTSPSAQNLPWPRLVRFGLFSLGGITVVSALGGYIGFAKFMAQQIVVTGAILGTMYIGFLTAGAVQAEGAFGRTTFGRRLTGRVSAEDGSLDKLGLMAGITINILVVLVGAPLIALQWGFQWGDIRAFAYRFATEIKIGSVTFSLLGILTGIIVFVIGYFLTRWFQRWLDGSVMSRGKVDAGVRNSIRTFTGYAGIAIAALVGLSAAGINLSSLALVAGALSLGIGFGLQNIVSNFVSGLILLAERPFKVGDWIVAGPVSGTVKKISVRATEIETFQRQTVILPNSELINAAVGNWTHRNKLGRVDIKVRAAYGSNARQVQEILLGVARAQPLAMKNPEPFVVFTNFGDLAMEFEVRLFLSDIMNANAIHTEVRMAVLDAFEREGIEIPIPPRNINLRAEEAAMRTRQADAVAPAIAPETLPDAALQPAPAGPRRRQRRNADPD